MKDVVARPVQGGARRAGVRKGSSGLSLMEVMAFVGLLVAIAGLTFATRLVMTTHLHNRTARLDQVRLVELLERLPRPASFAVAAGPAAEAIPGLEGVRLSPGVLAFVGVHEEGFAVSTEHVAGTQRFVFRSNGGWTVERRDTEAEPEPVEADHGS